MSATTHQYTDSHSTAQPFHPLPIPVEFIHHITPDGTFFRFRLSKITAKSWVLENLRTGARLPVKGEAAWKVILKELIESLNQKHPAPVPLLPAVAASTAVAASAAVTTSTVTAQPEMAVAAVAAPIMEQKIALPSESLADGYALGTCEGWLNAHPDTYPYADVPVTTPKGHHKHLCAHCALAYQKAMATVRLNERDTKARGLRYVPFQENA